MMKQPSLSGCLAQAGPPAEKGVSSKHTPGDAGFAFESVFRIARRGRDPSGRPVCIKGVRNVIRREERGVHSAHRVFSSRLLRSIAEQMVARRLRRSGLPTTMVPPDAYRRLAGVASGAYEQDRGGRVGALGAASRAARTWHLARTRSLVFRRTTQAPQRVCGPSECRLGVRPAHHTGAAFPDNRLGATARGCCERHGPCRTPTL